MPAYNPKSALSAHGIAPTVNGTQLPHLPAVQDVKYVYIESTRSPLNWKSSAPNQLGYLLASQSACLSQRASHLTAKPKIVFARAQNRRNLLHFPLATYAITNSARQTRWLAG